MTATPALQGAWTPASDHNAIPWAVARKLAASEQIGKGQFATVSLSTGYARLNDGSVPGEVSAGNGDVSELSDTSAIAGAAAARFSQRWFYGLKASTSDGDGFTDADFCVPFFIANENTLGKKSNLGGNNRSLGGLVFGLGVDQTPYAWDGPVAWALARSLLVADSKDGGWYQIADALAATTTSETAMSREKMHGVVTAVEFIGAAVTASNTDYAIITIAKRDGAGGGATTIATYDTRITGNGAITAFVPASFTLSVVAGALNLLETDVLTITVTKGGAGQVLTGSVRVIQKVL